MKRSWFVYVDWTDELAPRPCYVGKGNLIRTRNVNDRNYIYEVISCCIGLTREIVFETDIESEAFEAEKRFIAELHTYIHDVDYNCIGANKTRGGDGISGHIKTDEEKEKHRQGRLGKKHTPESKQKQSEVHKEWHKVPENREVYLASQATKDRSFYDDPEYKAKISKLHMGRKRPPTTGPKISASLKALNRKVPQTTKTTIATKLKGNRNAIRRKVARYDLEGNLLGVYDNTYLAAQSVGKVASGHLIQVCKGRKPTAHGYVWKYVDDIDVDKDK